MFGKFFASTFTGSMVGSGLNVFAVWGYVVANTRSDGYVELNPPIIAAMIGCEVEEIEKAIEVLSSPDPRSRSKKHDGRRLIQEAPFLFHVPNYADYRNIRDDGDRREYMRNYMREYRAVGKEEEVNVSSLRKQSKPRLAHAEAEAEADTEEEKKENHLSASRTMMGVNDVETIFAYWQEVLNHPKAKLTKERHKAIKARLKNYSVEDIKLAIDGCKKSPHHMGQNERQTVYDDIELICRTDTQIEKMWEHNNPRSTNGNGKNLNYREQRAQETINIRSAVDAARQRNAERDAARISGSDSPDSPRQLRGVESGSDGGEDGVENGDVGETALQHRPI